MQKIPILKTLTPGACKHWIIRSIITIPVCSILFMGGCVSMTNKDLRLVSKPNMQFNGSAIFNYQDKLLTQFESSSASFTGGQSGDCGSCVAGGTP